MENVDKNKNPCRICLTNNENDEPFVNIFTTFIKHSNVLISDAVNELCGLSISENDLKTQGICKICEKLYFEAYSLKQTTIRSDQILPKQVVIKSLTPIDRRKVKIIMKNEIPEPEIVEMYQSDGEEILGQSKPIKILNNIKVDPVDAVDFILMMGEQENSIKTLSKKKRTSDGSPNQLRRHSCEVCCKTFMKKSNLIDHLRLHANMKPFQCAHCDKSFVQSGNYKSHLRTHTQERPFACSHPGCNKSYNQSSALTIHIRSHTNEKNYICGTCEKRFTNSSDLKKHEGIHDQVKKYQCVKCDKGFAQKSHLMKHEISAHTNKAKQEKMVKVERTAAVNIL